MKIENDRFINFHREIYKKHYSIPKGYQIDHIDRNVYNNRLCNLRAVSRSENLKNRKSWKWSKNEKQ